MADLRHTAMGSHRLAIEREGQQKRRGIGKRL